MKTLLRHLCLMSLACALAATPRVASAWTLNGGQWFSNGGPIRVTYSYNNLLDGGLKGPDGVPVPVSLIRESVEEAFRLWAAVVPLHFEEVADDKGWIPVNGVEYPNGQFGQIRLHHLHFDGPDIPGQAPRPKAYSWFPIGSGNLPGDIFFDNSDPWQKVGTLPAPDILGAMIHELGHSIGLGHATDPNSNMFPVFRRYNGPGTNAALTDDDIEGIRFIYGAGVGSVTPLPVPEPASWVLAALGGTAVLRRRRSLLGGTDKP